MQKQQFTKPSISIPEQINLLKSRGLKFSNENFASHCLSTVNYYRLSAYIKPFEVDKKEHKILSNIDFHDIWNVYEFDRELRLLFLDALERIEVALRTALINVMSSRYGGWWHFDAALFKSSWFEINDKKKCSPAEDFRREVESLCGKIKSEGSIQHYYRHYNSPGSPPCWVIFEHMSFGKCTSLFRYLKHPSDKAAISETFGFHANIVESAIESLRYTRNICAHHLRLWDRWFVYKPRQIQELAQAGCKPGTFKEQLVLLMLFHFAISPQSQWKDRLQKAFEKHMTVSVPIVLMGIDNDWKNDLLWMHAK